MAWIVALPKNNHAWSTKSAARMSPEAAIVAGTDNCPLPETADVGQIESQALSIFVRDEVLGVATKLIKLRPYIEELWHRFDQGEVILGCSTRREFCERVLHRMPRTIRYLLTGGNRKGESFSPPEPDSSAPRPKPIEEYPSLADAIPVIRFRPRTTVLLKSLRRSTNS